MVEFWLFVAAPVIAPLIALALWPFFPEHEYVLFTPVMCVWGIAGFYWGVLADAYPY